MSDESGGSLQGCPDLRIDEPGVHPPSDNRNSRAMKTLLREAKAEQRPGRETEANRTPESPTERN